MPERPRVIILGGPNGAGKTTASRSLLLDTLHVVNFVNADVIAQGLAGFAPASAAIEASRIMLERLRSLAAQRLDFAFETTLAARSYAPWLKELHSQGYVVELHYFWLPSADLCVERVKRRVQLGGHDIPEKTIRQRHGRSINNFINLYLPLADQWWVYDTSGAVLQTIAAGECIEILNIAAPEAWDEIVGSSTNG